MNADRFTNLLDRTLDFGSRTGEVGRYYEVPFRSADLIKPRPRIAIAIQTPIDW